MGMVEIKVKTADLAGAALDWAVAQIECVRIKINFYGGEIILDIPGTEDSENGIADTWEPSDNWAQGGPLIDKYGLGVAKFFEPVDGPVQDGFEWAAIWRDDSTRMDGPSALIAVCRAIVAAKLGEVVSVPAELMPCE